MSKKDIVFVSVIAFLLVIVAAGTLFFVPPGAFLVALGLAVAIGVFFTLTWVIRGQRVRERYPRRWHNAFSFFSYFFILTIVFSLLYFYAISSVIVILLMVALVFTVVTNFIAVPLAILHWYREHTADSGPLKHYHKISIIVPAYNEEKVLSRTIENLLEAYYPNKEIIIVDDGSEDRTWEVAQKYVQYGIKVVRRVNGGKYAALNTGLTYATGEIVITVDADSLVNRSALVEIVRNFVDLDVGGVAGNLKVLNRNNLITRLQSLEYLTQIEVVRRAFDNFGTVTVAPGAFSAFRRTAMAESGNYDPDRLLEDFDLTIKLQKAHKVLRGNSDAVCYTEAPETISDVYKQRLSWYRGDFQNFWKHRDAFFNTKFGYMQALTFPYMLLAMTFVPLASILVVATSIIMLLNGQGIILLYAFMAFVFLQFLLSVLAIKLGNDDMKLCIYAPFYIIGYKQFLDYIMLKAFFDVLLNRGQYLKRERVQRIGA